MTCPLPLSNASATSVKDGVKNGNRGLYFNKYFDRWLWSDDPHTDIDYEKGDPKKKKPEGKAAWIDEFCRKPLPGVLEDHITRAEKLAIAARGGVKTYVTQGPFVTGVGLPHPVENGFLWHHTLGVPYLPGSSVKGTLRAWVRDWKDAGEEREVDLAHLFGITADDGKETAPGVLIVFDALPVGKITLYREVITPHDGGWRISPMPEKNPPADWISPIPIPFLAVKEGAKFQFAFGLRKGGTKDDLKAAFKLLKDALDWIGAGAKTSVGFGRMVAETDLAGLNAVRAARQERWIVEGAAVAAVPKPPPEDGTVIPAGQWVRLGDGEAILREPYTMGSGTSVLLSSQSDGNFSVEARDIVDWG